MTIEKIVEKGVYWLIAIIIAVSIYGFIRGYPDYDDTDNVEEGIRSGMMLYTDNRTGCQYLATRTLFTISNLVPRVDESGQHICS